MKKLVKRSKHNSPSTTLPMFVIPTFTYSFMKIAGVEFNQYEFIWWIIIPALFISWLYINFKVKEYLK